VELRGVLSRSAAGIPGRIETRVGVLPNVLTAFRAGTVRGGVTNVSRHSRARRCEILLTRDGDEVRAEITDDGRGPSPEGTGVNTGSGLRGPAERVESSSGDSEARSLPEGGFRLRVSLPLRGGANLDGPVSRAGGGSSSAEGQL